MNMNEDISSVLFTEAQIKSRVSELSAGLSAAFYDKNPIFVGVLKGSFIFMSDLIRGVTVPCTLDFMAVSSYGDKASSSGAVKILYDLNHDITGRHIIVVEDILDSGLTLSYLLGYMKNRSAASVTLVALLDKPSRRKADIRADYLGFSVPDAFVVGYGLDYAEKYRNLPYIGILKPEVYSG